MRTLARLVLWVAIVLFVAVGVSGVLFGPWELDIWATASFDVTAMNQMRFLKAMELAMGLMLFFLRAEALDSPKVNRAVVALLWVTPLARVVSLGLDGVPDPSFVALMIVELSGAVTMTAYHLTRFSPRGSRRAGSAAAATSA